MTLYFAYGANMERDAMRKRCPGATALGIAALRGHRYVIARGYGAFARAPGACVFGVLWRLTLRRSICSRASTAGCIAGRCSRSSAKASARSR